MSQTNHKNKKENKKEEHDKDVNWGKLFNKIPAGHDNETRKTINDIIVRANEDMEVAILLLVEEILESLMIERGIAVDMANMTKEQIKELEEMIEEYMENLKEGGHSSESEALRLLLHVIHKRITKLASERYKDFKFDFMSKKQLKEYKKHLKMMMEYEIYKFVNPHRIAGETILENFINNVIHYGVQFAAHEVVGHTLDQIEALYGLRINDLSKLHKEFVNHASNEIHLQPNLSAEFRYSSVDKPKTSHESGMGPSI